MKKDAGLSGVENGKMCMIFGLQVFLTGFKPGSFTHQASKKGARGNGRSDAIIFLSLMFGEVRRPLFLRDFILRVFAFTSPFQSHNPSLYF